MFRKKLHTQKNRVNIAFCPIITPDGRKNFLYALLFACMQRRIGCKKGFVVISVKPVPTPNTTCKNRLGAKFPVPFYPFAIEKFRLMFIIPINKLYAFRCLLDYIFGNYTFYIIIIVGFRSCSEVHITPDHGFKPVF